MFARKVKNRSGSISVQVISKHGGLYRVVQTVGTSNDPDEIDRFWLRAQSLARMPDPQQGSLFSLHSERDHLVQNLVASLNNAQIRTIGPELIFGTVFDHIGFNRIPDTLFRHMVITRLVSPGSKLKTIDYLWRYQGITLSASALYRGLDRLYNRYKAEVETIVTEHTRQRLGTLAAVFYDVTTLFFETEDEDDLRKVGLSKDGKFQHPQITLGLLVGAQGMPIGYDLFPGNTFEGHTLLPILTRYEHQYGCGRPVVVADAAMLSKANLDSLAAASYPFIVAARIKNESEAVKEQLLARAHGISDGAHFVIEQADGRRLLVTYSEKRAAKDRQRRQAGLTRLHARVKTGRLTKEHLNKRGYNKFLVFEGDLHIHIDQTKIDHDQRWDGLKGYVTNTTLAPNIVVGMYSQLWQIERAFRISKTDLRVRPIFHYQRRRIEAHVCISFVAYAIYKELESLLAQRAITMSGRRAAELTKTMYQIVYQLPDSPEMQKQVLAMSDEQKLLYDTVKPLM
jgi:transposase